MKLTPMDISNKEFRKVFRGYDCEEVDEFINEIIDNYEELYKENSRLKENLSRVNEKLEHYVKIENTIQNTLLLAQNAAEQARETSQRESEIILKNANESAKRIIDKAHNDVISINDEYEKVKQEFVKFRAKFRNFMNAQTETFDELEKDLTKNYNISEPIENLIAEKSIKVADKNLESIDDVYTDDMEEIKSFFAQAEE
jgi:cell division initiation protein